MPSKIAGLSRELIALRIANELRDGSYVNLGIGIPTLVSNWIEGRDIILQSEIGMLKSGQLASDEEMDIDLINASCQPVCQVKGMSFFDICESFSMIRGGYMDYTVVGAFQVSERGDLASWANPIRGLHTVGNIGGSMDLCAGAKQLFVAMEHTTQDGEIKIVKSLTYPATGRGVVSRIFTDLAVIEVIEEGLLLKEIYPGLTVDQLQSITDPKLLISPDLKEIDL